MTDSQQAKADACQAKNSFRESKPEPCNVCEKCKNDPDKCTLYPYDGDCCKAQGKTGHHVLPKHCMYPPGQASKGKKGQKYQDCQDYNPNKAPCICVTGTDKSGETTEHARLHDKFDQMEDSHKEPDGSAGTWTYDEASAAGAQCVAKVFPECSEGCVKAQLDEYHQKEIGMKDDTDLRADSRGQSGSPDIAIADGSVQATAADT